MRIRLKLLIDVVAVIDLSRIYAMIKILTVVATPAVNTQ